MKKVIFIAQAKGGVGKSILAYLTALSMFQEESSLFADCDSSTETSTKQLHFMGSDRTETVSLLNHEGVLVRDKLISYLDSLKNTPHHTIVLDMGAPESEQLPALFQFDIPLKELADLLDFDIHFRIVIGGGGAYKSSMEYAIKLLKALKNEFKVELWESKTTFNNFIQLEDELKSNAEKLGLPLIQFGNFAPSTDIGSTILDGIRRGLTLDEYPIGAKLRLMAEIKNIQQNG